MANIGNIFGSIRIRTDALKRDLQKASTGIKRFTADSSNKFNKMSRSILNMRTALIGLAVGFTLKKAVTEFVRFEDAMLDLQKVMGDTEGNVQQFEGTIKKLSSQFGKSSADILQGAANFKQAGFSAVEAFELQKHTLDLVTISELETAEASELLVSALKGFKAPATEAARLIDIMNEISNKYATNLRQLAVGMAQLSPIAKIMGFSFEETASVLTPIIEVFRSGSEAGNALKIGLLRLVSDNRQVIDALHRIGIEQTDLNGVMKSGKDILREVQQAFTGLDNELKIVVAGELAGARQAGRLLEVYDGLNKVLEVERVAYNALGSAQKEVEIRMKSLGVKLDRLKVAVQNLFIKVGESLSPALGELAEKITAVDAEQFALEIRAIGSAFAFATEGVFAFLTGIRQVADAMFPVLDQFLRSKEAIQGLKELERITEEANAERAKLEIEKMKKTRIPGVGDQSGLTETVNIKGKSVKVFSKHKEMLRDLFFLKHTGKEFDERMKSVRTTLGEIFNLANKLEQRTIAAKGFVSKAPSEINVEEFAKFLKRKDQLTLTSKEIALKAFKEEIEGFKRLAKSRGHDAEQMLKDVEVMNTKGLAAINEKFRETEKGLDSITNKADSSFGQMGNAVSGWASDFSRNLTDVLWNANATFDNILESFGKMITQMVIQTQVIQPLMASLFGFSNAPMGGMTGPPTLKQSQGGLLGRIFGFAQGGIVPGATGQPVPAIVHGGEQIIPAQNRIQGMGNGVQVNIIGAPEGTNVREGETSSGERKIDVIIDEKMAENVRPGSRFMKALSKQSNVQQTLIGR